MMQILLSVLSSHLVMAAPPPIFVPEAPKFHKDFALAKSKAWVCMAQGEDLSDRQMVTTTGQGHSEEAGRTASMQSCSGSALGRCRVLACFEKDALVQ